MVRMRGRIAVAVLGLVLAVPGTAAAGVAERVELRYTGDLLASGHVADSTPNGVHGAVLLGGGGTVTSVVELSGNRYLRFPAGTCLVPPCAQAIVQPIRSDTLVPGDGGTGRFSFGADARLTEEPSPAAGMNVFQYGAAAAGVSQWKLQLDYGRPSCRWSDGTNVVLLMAGDPGYRLPLGAWHRIRCTRLSPVLFEVRVVDPRTGAATIPPTYQVASVGPILPTGAVVIGGKRIRDTQSDVDTDQFHGDLDNIVFARS
jgi:hypothetical protein